MGGVSRLRSLALTGLVLGVAWAGGRLLQEAVGRRDETVRDGARLLDEVMERVRTMYVEPVEEERLWELATRGLLDQLGDPNTAYLTPERRAALERTASNSYPGVGLQVDAREGWIVVVQARPGTPAEQAGLVAGDRLVSVDGRPMRGWTVAEAREALRGPAGTALTLEVEPPGGARRTVRLARAEIHVNSIARATLLDGGVGYVVVTTFGDSTEVELVRAVDSLRTAGARALLLDLRGNPGGLLAQGVGVADLFLDAGARVVTTAGRTAAVRTTYVDSTAARWTGMPVSVLVNGLTASAAEIVAGALQDNDRALIVGRPTYGKGSAQAIYKLDNGAALSLTNARWYTPLGRSIEYPAATDDEAASETPVDTARPRLRTPAGRTVLGGGGIVPDVVVGDSLAELAAREFTASLGRDLGVWRSLVQDLAEDLVREGAVRDTLFQVAPPWRARLAVVMRRRGLVVAPETFAAASAVVDRVLASEIARTAFGAPYAQRQSLRTDVAIQRAAGVLRRAVTARDVFAPGAP
ncbi:MAG: hypothetical protein RL139_1398 [Gemmatimonadota bacterium]|jgi:carboxyl-terminal processing protease